MGDGEYAPEPPFPVEAMGGGRPHDHGYEYDWSSSPMSSKMTCPGCGAHTSAVLMAVRNEEPCPSCGLSAEAIIEVTEVRQRAADEDLKARLEQALIERGRLETEVNRLREMVSDVRQAIGCDREHSA